MKIVFFPAYSFHSASSRIRVYALQRALRIAGYDAIVGGTDNDGQDADVIVIQKRTDPETFGKAEKSKALVVYDYDDRALYQTLPCAIQIAKVLTTDTEGHRAESMSFWQGKTECVVLPDAIDYFPDTPMPATCNSMPAWFGNHPNFESARWMANAFRSANISYRLITDAGTHQDQEVVPWSYDGFTESLRGAGISFLSHENADTSKSNNKMVTSIIHGLPAVVSNTLEYAALAHQVGYPETIVSSPDQLIESYHRFFNKAEREKYLSMAQPYVWERYHARTIAKQFIDMIEEYL